MAELHTQVVPRRVRFDPTRPRGADAYGHAFRHSRRVTFLKFALPTIAAISIAAFFLTMRFADITRITSVTAAGLNVDAKSLTMEAPHMSGFDASRHPYQLKAIKAVQDLINPQVVNLDTIDARFATDDANTAVLKARSGVLNNVKNTLTLKDGITIRTSDGYQATMIDADIDITKGKLISTKPVEVHSSDGNWLKANGVHIEDKGAKVTFIDGVSVNYIPSDQDASPAAPERQTGTDAAAGRIRSATE
jgi:lipopolysaccharide export system protein LptC